MQRYQNHPNEWRHQKSGDRNESRVRKSLLDSAAEQRAEPEDTKQSRPDYQGNVQPDVGIDSCFLVASKKQWQRGKSGKKANEANRPVYPMVLAPMVHDALNSLIWLRINRNWKIEMTTIIARRINDLALAKPVLKFTQASL